MNLVPASLTAQGASDSHSQGRRRFAAGPGTWPCKYLQTTRARSQAKQRANDTAILNPSCDAD